MRAHTHTHTHARTHTHTHTHIYMYTYICTHMYMYICIYTYMLYTHQHTYTHIITHTHIYIYIYIICIIIYICIYICIYVHKSGTLKIGDRGELPVADGPRHPCSLEGWREEGRRADGQDRRSTGVCCREMNFKHCTQVAVESYRWLTAPDKQRQDPIAWVLEVPPPSLLLLHYSRA